MKHLNLTNNGHSRSTIRAKHGLEHHRSIITLISGRKYSTYALLLVWHVILPNAMALDEQLLIDDAVLIAGGIDQNHIQTVFL